jgi:hypothetical protein
MGLVIKRAAEVAAEALAAHRASIASAVDTRIDEQARALGYNSAAHIAGYVNSTVPQWAAEAQAFIAWRDAVWLAVFAIEYDAVQTGEAPTLDAVLAALPEWGAP